MGAFDWKTQVVVITGASGGIGASLARELGKRGASVVLAARRPDKLAEVAATAGASTLTVTADVTKREDVARIASEAIARFGRVDVWVNNVGRGISRHVLDLTDDDVDTMIRANVKSTLYGMQAVVPHFKERKRGHLLNVSSMLGRIPFAPIRSAYSAAKAAMGSLTETLRMELSSGYADVVVTCVYPGVVATDFGLNALGGGPDSRSFPGGQSPEDVATVIADAIEQRRGGDVYTRPDADERVVGHLRALASAK